MDRRSFVRLMTAAPLSRALEGRPIPRYRVVSEYAPAPVPGMPGPFPGRVVDVGSRRCLDEALAAREDVVKEMLADGMRALTGETSTSAAWQRFFEPSDVVGIKVNCGGHPYVVSAPTIVAEIVRQLESIGVPPAHVYVYERFQNQLDEVDYGPRIPEGVQIEAAESFNRRVDNRAYDPDTYVEMELFGEENTRSNMMRLVTRRLTKIINVPNMKDHGATGVTGCLKNIAYGSFSNVARTHKDGVSHTYSCVGTFAAVEPLRSRTVLQIMDGLHAVWHGGPFARTPRYVFHPRRILLGTDPVAIDRLLLDIIDDKRRAEGAISIWDRSPDSVRVDDTVDRDADPNVNIMIREPGHVEYASRLGLGVYDRERIQVDEIEL